MVMLILQDSPVNADALCESSDRRSKKCRRVVSPSTAEDKQS